MSYERSQEIISREKKELTLVVKKSIADHLREE